MIFKVALTILKSQKCYMLFFTNPKIKFIFCICNQLLECDNALWYVTKLSAFQWEVVPHFIGRGTQI